MPEPRTVDLWIFDADDTLRRTIVAGQPCPHAPGEWELLPGVAERLGTIPWDDEQGPWFAIASNQDRVGYGRFSEAVARDLLRELARAATGRTPPDVALQLCPHRIEEECECRKPRPRMLRRIMEHYGVPADRTVFIGDSDGDRLAAAAAGVHFVPAAEFFSSSGAPSARRSRRTPRRGGAGSYDGGAPRTTRG